MSRVTRLLMVVSADFFGIESNASGTQKSINTLEANLSLPFSIAYSQINTNNSAVSNLFGTSLTSSLGSVTISVEESAVTSAITGSMISIFSK